MDPKDDKSEIVQSDAFALRGKLRVIGRPECVQMCVEHILGGGLVYCCCIVGVGCHSEEGSTIELQSDGLAKVRQREPRELDKLVAETMVHQCMQPLPVTVRNH